MPGPDRASRQHNLKDFYHGTIRHTPNRSLEGAVAQRLRVFSNPSACSSDRPTPHM